MVVVGRFRTINRLKDVLGDFWTFLKFRKLLNTFIHFSFSRHFKHFIERKTKWLTQAWPQETDYPVQKIKMKSLSNVFVGINGVVQ